MKFKKKGWNVVDVESVFQESDINIHIKKRKKKIRSKVKM